MIDTWFFGFFFLRGFEMKVMQMQSGGPTLKEPARWSVEFVSFVERCLVVDPSKRATAAELLDHPFFKKYE
jgi:serine/threonine protein kinase